MVKWEVVKSVRPDHDFKRAKVPGGWFIMFMISLSPTMTFYPDPNHEWNGDSLS
jgi:hypothetical protein